ncbi:MAG: hypothetical protein LLG06_16595 [Desulfobacteraceae bacterium]|nr:hypothetical protein [Desulfobacteraceae bacterium]
MKAVLAVFALLLLLAGCATSDTPDPRASQSEVQMKYGGSYRVRGMTSSGVYR